MEIEEKQDKKWVIFFGNKKLLAVNTDYKKCWKDHCEQNVGFDSHLNQIVASIKDLFLQS